jgi:hypothetical protein
MIIYTGPAIKIIIHAFQDFSTMTFTKTFDKTFDENQDPSYKPMTPLTPEYYKNTVTRWESEGRDHTGVLLSHQDNCCCMGCMPEPAKTMTPFGRLFGAAYEAEAERFSAGEWWGLFSEELLASEDALAAEYRATFAQRNREIDERIALQDRKVKVERVALREGAMRTRNGPVEIRHLPQPCKFLYNCQGTPARPTTMNITTECWSHEKGVCPWAHPAMPARAAMKLADGSTIPAAAAIPADPLWCPQWATDRLFKPVTAETENRFAGLATKLAPKHDHQHEHYNRRESRRY